MPGVHLAHFLHARPAGVASHWRRKMSLDSNWLRSTLIVFLLTTSAFSERLRAFSCYETVNARPRILSLRCCTAPPHPLSHRHALERHSTGRDPQRREWHDAKHVPETFIGRHFWLDQLKQQLLGSRCKLIRCTRRHRPRSNRQPTHPHPVSICLVVCN